MPVLAVAEPCVPPLSRLGQRELRDDLCCGAACGVAWRARVSARERRESQRECVLRRGAGVRERRGAAGEGGWA